MRQCAQRTGRDDEPSIKRARLVASIRLRRICRSRRCQSAAERRSTIARLVRAVDIQRNTIGIGLSLLFSAGV